MPAPVQLKAEPAKTSAQVITDSDQNREKAERNITALWDNYRSQDGNNWASDPATNKKINGKLKVQSRLLHDFNRITVHASSSLTIQPKLAVNAPGDEYEQEADAVADKIMQMPETASQDSNHAAGNTLLHKPANGGEVKEKEKNEEEEQPEPAAQKMIQRKYATGGDDDNDDDDERSRNKSSAKAIPLITPKVHQVLQSPGQPLDTETRSFMESRFGFNFSTVQIHNNAMAHQSARSINALAYTHQNNIVFGEGQYRPQTPDGKRLLAHELAHVVQQRERMQSNIIQRKAVADVNVALNAAITALDKPAYMDALRIEKAAHSEDPVIYATIQGHQAGGSISVKEAWQAVLILNYGDDSDRPHPWPETIRNFFEGISLGTYTVSAIAPLLKDDILQLAVSTAHTAITTSIGTKGGGKGMGPFMNYMGKFNALWGTSTFSGMSDAFDNTLNSKGPRTERSRAIFDHLYSTDANVKTDYDKNVKGLNTGTEGMRELADQYVGPDSRNLVASPRLQSLREKFFSQSLISSANLANADYVSFKSKIKLFAEALNETDRQEIKNSHEWQSIIDRTVVKPALRQDLAQYLDNAYLTAAAPANTNLIVGVGTNIAGTAAVSGSGPVAVSVPPPALSADQQIFVDNMTLNASSLAITSEDEVTDMELFGKSTRDEAGLALKTRVVIDNPAKHRGGSGDTMLSWPATSATGNIHKPRVTTGTGKGSTVYNATLTLNYPDGTPIVRTGGAAIPPVSITITDNRYGAFVSNMTANLFQFFVGGQGKWFKPGAKVNYTGGQGPLDINPTFDFIPKLGASFSLPNGLAVFSEGTVTQNGSTIGKVGPKQFPPRSSNSYLGQVIAVGPKAPPAADAMVVSVNFREGTGTGPVFHTRTEAFNIDQSVADAAGTTMPAQLTALSAQLAADKKALNSVTPVPPIPASGAGTILDEMIHHGTPQSARIAQTILAGTISLDPMIIRPDSAAFMAAQVAGGHNRWKATSATHAVFALGDKPLDVAPVSNPPNTIEESANVNAIQWPEARFKTTLHIHLTTSLNPLIQRTNFTSIVQTIVHEALHMVDIRPGSNSDIEKYKTEFRAYWMDGRRDKFSTRFDPTMDSLGPKSEKARAIFKHLYYSTTYKYVKTAYDDNTNGFRDQVNAFIIPDGINLLVSQKLEDIRAAIAGFGATYGAAQQTKIKDLYNGNAAAVIISATAEDKREISGNRYWRTLVESKGFSPADLALIKKDLNIPV